MYIAPLMKPYACFVFVLVLILTWFIDKAGTNYTSSCLGIDWAICESAKTAILRAFIEPENPLFEACGVVVD